MKSIDQWLAEYGESHQNPTNKKVHFICVPLIFFSIVGLLYTVKIHDFSFFSLNLAEVILVLVAVYYFMLSGALAVGMILYSLFCLGICMLIEGIGIPLWIFCITVFVLAWIGQFWGHRVEGKKPSFLKDIQFLMIGPAWIMSFIYRKIGLNI